MDVMEFRLIDNVMAYQLEEGDLIAVDNIIVPIVSIIGNNNGYSIFYLDEFEELESIELSDDQIVGIYMVD